jgi:hypothetical protein
MQPDFGAAKPREKGGGRKRDSQRPVDQGETWDNTDATSSWPLAGSR